MKTTRRAIESLKRSKKESLSYLITLILSAGLLFLFINIQNDSNVLPQSGTAKSEMLNNTLLSGFTLLIAVICAINCYVANTYFVKAKNQELCVYLTCGMKITVLAKFLITQNMILLAIAVPVGALMGCILLPIVNIIITGIGGITGFLFSVSLKGILTWILILFFEMFFLVLINIGYTYRTELKDLLDENNSIKLPDYRIFKIPGTFYLAISILAFLASWFVPAQANYLSICAMIAFLGIKGILTLYLPKQNEKHRESRKQLNCEKIILHGNVNALMKSSFMYNLMVFATILVICLCATTLIAIPYLRMVLIIAYVLALSLISASIYFKILIEAGIRKREYQQLSLLGFSKEGMRICLRKEIIRFNAYLFLFPIPYAFVICFRLIGSGSMSFLTAIVIFATIAILFILLLLLSIHSYEKIVLYEEKGEMNDDKCN